MTRSRLSTLFLVAGVTLACLAQSALAGFRLDYPDQLPGPPYYATVAYVAGEPVTPVIFYHVRPISRRIPICSASISGPGPIRC